LDPVKKSEEKAGNITLSSTVSIPLLCIIVFFSVVLAIPIGFVIGTISVSKIVNSVEADRSSILSRIRIMLTRLNPRHRKNEKQKENYKLEEYEMHKETKKNNENECKLCEMIFENSDELHEHTFDLHYELVKEFQKKWASINLNHNNDFSGKNGFFFSSLLKKENLDDIREETENKSRKAAFNQNNDFH
jgi:hypothetical protein